MADAAIQFVNGDLCDDNFAGASVVYSNAVVFDSTLCSVIGRLIDEADLSKSAFVATATKRFSLPTFDLVDVLHLSCNGGEDFTFYASQKRGGGGTNVVTRSEWVASRQSPIPSRRGGCADW